MIWPLDCFMSVITGIIRWSCFALAVINSSKIIFYQFSYPAHLTIYYWSHCACPHHVAVLALRGTIPVVKLHALQGAMTAQATEAVGVEEFIHGPHCRLSTGQGLATLPTNLWNGKRGKRTEKGRERDYLQIRASSSSAYVNDIIVL